MILPKWHKKRNKQKGEIGSKLAEMWKEYDDYIFIEVLLDFVRNYFIALTKDHLDEEIKGDD